MKVIKSISHFLSITIFFGILSGFSAVANPLCSIERFTQPFLLSTNIVVNEVADNKFEIMQKQNNISDLSAKLNENNFSLTFTQNAQISETSERSGFGMPEKTSTISLSHSLNFYQQNIKHRLLKEQIKLEKIQLHQLQLKRQIAKLKLIAELSQANNLNSLYLEKKRLIDEELKYYSAWRDAGKPDFDKELSVQSEASTNRDKIFANSILVNDLKQKMSIDDKTSKLVTIPTTPLSILLADVCKLENFQVLNLSLEIRVLNMELESLAFDKDFELNLEGKLSSQVDRRGNNSNQTQASIVFSKNLYDGDQTKNERKKLLSDINLKKSQIKEIILSSNNDMILRKNREEVLITSLNSISAEIQGIDERIKELKQRQNLGQTVFLEITSNKKEQLRLKESALRITTDFITGWYDFLSNRRQKNV